LSAPIKAVPQPIFIKKVHELAGLLKRIEAGSEDAVDIIVDTMNTDDKEVSKEVKAKIAVKLIELQIKIADTISKDQLTRQIAEIKVKGLSTPLGLEGEKKKLPPMLDFSNIEQV
jgi:hypothetical protein